TCLAQLLTNRGRVISPTYLDKLLVQKSSAYIQALSENGKLPLYPGLEDFLYRIKAASLPLGLVTGNSKAEVDWVLAQANLTQQFAITVTGADVSAYEDKPATKLYERAIAGLQEQIPGLQLAPQECLAVEASFAGITAAKQAGVAVVGVAHLYPYRMMQRQANWAVDYLNEIDLDWIQPQYSPNLFAVNEAIG
ncbi:MAG: HAD family phosphatase, partial [Leptolyngbya sp. SIO1D8]|nr:HAD family phosphatase [Leptolyngbya sp. SIO1D8]